jgi:acetyl esterase/lipase
MIMRWRAALLAAVVVGACSAAPAQDVPTFANVRYAVVGGKALNLDIYLPGFGHPPYPTVVWVHGGSWKYGDKSPLTQHVDALRDEGFAVVSVNYRLTSEAGQYSDEPVIWPAQIHDLKGAIRFLRAKGDGFKLDTGRIAVWGTSAGGHLAAVLGTSGDDPDLEGIVGGNLEYSSAVACVVDYCGPTDLLGWNEDIQTPPGSVVKPDQPNSAASRLVGWDEPGQGLGDIKKNLDNPEAPYPELVERARSASAIHWVGGEQDPPEFLIIHGGMDTVVPHRQSERLAIALNDAGFDALYFLFPDAEHNALGPEANELATAFILEHVVACKADQNRDLVLDLFDFLAYTNTYLAEDPEADCTGDGSLDLFDFLCFTNIFNVGC